MNDRLIQSLFEKITGSLVPDRPVDLGGNTVTLHKGIARNLVIQRTNGHVIDLSEDVDLETDQVRLTKGTESWSVIAPHDDERDGDAIPFQRSFPENPDDIAFLSGIAQAARISTVLQPLL